MLDLASINWAAVLGALNLGVMVTLIGLLTSYHRKHTDLLRDQIDHLRSLKHSEFTEEVRSFRIHYEEKTLMLEDKFKEAAARATDAEEKLSSTIRALGISPSDNLDLVEFIRNTFPLYNPGRLANFAHEIRTPLTGILGYSAVIANESTEVDIKEMANIMQQHGYGLLEALNHLVSDSIGSAVRDS